MYTYNRYTITDTNQVVNIYRLCYNIMILTYKT